MKVSDLKALVRKHNLDNAITRYSTMKKSELVDALMKHSSQSGSFSPPLTITKADGTVKELKKRVKKATVKPTPKPAPKPAPKKAAPKPKKKVTLVIEKATPKPVVKKSKDVKLKKLTPADIADLSKSIPKRKGKRIVVESDDDEDDFFSNIGKGKGAIKKTTLSASYLASKKALRELRLKDPAAYQAKINAQSAAQKAKGNPLDEFDKKKKAVRKKQAAKPAAKPAAPKPAAKPAAKPVVKGSPEKIIEQYLGDFEKLKRMIFDQRRKVKGEEKEFLSDTVERINRIVDKYAPEDATVKASVNTGLKQPTLTELGLSGAVPDKDWVKKTEKEVSAFIKANEKTMRDAISKQKSIIREKKIADKLGETKEKALEKERIRDQKRADKVAANEAKRKEIAGK